MNLRSVNRLRLNKNLNSGFGKYLINFLEQPFTKSNDLIKANQQYHQWFTISSAMGISGIFENPVCAFPETHFSLPELLR